LAKYTVELRTIVESGFPIFDFPYEFYREDKKAEFEQMFIQHFKYREICCETIGRWKDYLIDKFNVDLPYYNMLLKAAELDYNIFDNYRLTETTTRNIQKEGTLNNTINASTNTYNTGSINETGSNTTNIDRETGIVNTGLKESTLDSKTEHTENTEFNRDQTGTEKTKATKTIDKTADLKKIHSDTPQSVINLSNLSGGVYASSADIEDNKEKVNDTENADVTKTDKNKEVTEKSVKDEVVGKTKDTSTDTSDETTKEKQTQTAQNSSTINNTSNSTNSTTNNQSIKDNQSEIITLERVGNIGVDTDMDALAKHIKLQTTLTTIYKQFFAECEDLFMQVY